MKQAVAGSSGVIVERGPQVSGRLAFMTVDDGVHGFELWRSDGTAAGTFRLTDIRPGPTSSDPGSVVRLASDSWLFAAENSSGPVLYVTDGTRSGTKLVKNVKARPVLGMPATVVGLGVVLDHRAYFAATDGRDNQSTHHGQELWVSDGTANGTKLVKDIRPASGTGQGDSNPIALSVFGNALLFAAYDGTGWGLWRSDGTAAGTTLLKDIAAPGLNDEPVFPSGDPFPSLNGQAYFVADDGTGAEVWVSDGTTTGTHVLTDINAAGSSNPGSPEIINGRAYFSADNGNGYHLYSSDGTALGTHRISSAAAQTYLYPIFGNNGHVYLVGTNASDGSEPWVYNP